MNLGNAIPNIIGYRMIFNIQMQLLPERVSTDCSLLVVSYCNRSSNRSSNFLLLPDVSGICADSLVVKHPVLTTIFTTTRFSKTDLLSQTTPVKCMVWMSKNKTYPKIYRHLLPVVLNGSVNPPFFCIWKDIYAVNLADNQSAW